MTREVGGHEGAVYGGIVSIARDMTLRIERLRKEHDLTAKHVIHVRAFVVAIFIGAEGMIVAHVEIGAAELESVSALHPGQAA